MNILPIVHRHLGPRCQLGLKLRDDLLRLCLNMMFQFFLLKFEQKLVAKQLFKIMSEGKMKMHRDMVGGRCQIVVWKAPRNFNLSPHTCRKRAEHS